jgi:transposase
MSAITIHHAQGTPAHDDLVIQLVAENRALKAQIDLLKEQLRLAIARRFGRSSEKLPSGEQLELFNEAELTACESTAAPAVVEEPVTVVASHPRKKAGRKPLPESLERVEIVHDLPEEAKICPHDGTALVKK